MENSENKPSRFPVIGRLVEWIFSVRTLRRLLFTLITLVTLVALYYAQSNFRGKRAWEKYRAEQAAKGVMFELEASVPPPVPADENFAMTPFLAPLFDFEPGTQKAKDTNAFQRAQSFGKDVGHLSAYGTWREGVRIDLSAYLRETIKPKGGSQSAADTYVFSRAAAATNIVAGLNASEAVLDEIRQAATRPKARFNIRYEEENSAGILLPHLSVIRNLSRVLTLRAIAELELGQTDAAMADIILVFRMVEAIKTEPTLISQLVRLACLQELIQPVWEGLSGRNWSDTQLQVLQAKFAEFNLIQDLRWSMDRGERMGFGGRMFDYIRKNPSVLGALTVDGNADAYWSAVRFVPKGWLYYEQLNYHKLFEEWVLPGSDPAARRVFPKVVEGNAKKLEALFKGPPPLRVVWEHRVLSAMLIPAVVNVHKRGANGQNSADQALIGCAVERYRLRHGALPETLDALMPAFLPKPPHDVITGEPLKYIREEKGGYLIYSVGWDEKDEGGRIVIGNGKKVDLEKGDWVWKVPGK